MSVRVTFDYEPDEPDDEHPVGMSEGEHARLMGTLAEIGATDVKVERA